LPDKPGVRKVHQAVSDRSGSIDIYYIPADTIEQLRLPQWVRGSNSVNKVHPKVLRELQTRKIVNPESYFAKDTVRVTDMETLLKEQNVATFQYLKLDTEGHDCVILQSLLHACQRNRAWFPRKILFETNFLTPKKNVDETCALFEQQGYKVKRGQPDSQMFRQW
jgi:FkbM family methyltransferase